jgi:uncharacterized protein with PIN domain
MEVGEPGSAPRFVVDAMLGRLARWLRVLGYDALYSSGADDAALVRRALAEERILLTRDVELARRRGVRVILISDDRIGPQLREIVEILHLSAHEAFSRCINCNAPLVEFDRARARDLVPPYVFATQTRFRRCAECGKVYWRGSHWAHMRATLESAQGSENNLT